MAPRLPRSPLSERTRAAADDGYLTPATKSNAEGQCGLGAFNEHGEGGSQNDVRKAVGLHEKSAMQEHARAG
jgi:TPR repeat protein